MRVELEQGSLEWHEHRVKYNNASEAAIIMDCAPAYWGMTKRKLWEQKNGLRGSNVDENNPAILHGKNMEAAALDCFNKKMGVNCQPAVFVADSFSASLDGYGEGSEGGTIKVEIKCPFKAESSAVWKAAASGEIAEYYRWQMVHQDKVESTDLSFFFVYISDDKNIVLPHVSSDDDIIRLTKAWNDFNASEPEPDEVIRTDEKIRALVERHRDLIQQRNILDVELKIAEKALKVEAGDGVVKAFGATIKTIERKGAVDYSQVPELESVNLDDFRKPSTFYQKISHERS